MAKAKVARKSTAIDMTPMVDLAFLLITFFMLTVKFKQPDAVEIATPSSIATTKKPETDILEIHIGKEGAIFMALSSKNDRLGLIERISEKHGYNFSAEEKENFAVMGFVGVPVNQVKEFVNRPLEQRLKALKEGKGLSVDSTDNQLQEWMLQARLHNPNLRIVIKADQKTPYPVIREVINTLKKQKANKFNLLTSQEADPRSPQPAAGS